MQCSFILPARQFADGGYLQFLPSENAAACQGQVTADRRTDGADALHYFRHRPFALFMFASLLACVGMMPYWSLGSLFLNTCGIERPAVS